MGVPEGDEPSVAMESVAGDLNPSSPTPGTDEARSGGERQVAAAPGLIAKLDAPPPGYVDAQSQGLRALGSAVAAFIDAAGAPGVDGAPGLAGQNGYYKPELNENPGKIPISFPVRFEAEPTAPKSIIAGEVAILTAKVSNISTQSYGGAPDQSLALVDIFVLLSWVEAGEQKRTGEWQSISPLIGPGQQIEVPVQFLVDTGALPFSLVDAEVHLLLNKESIEYRKLTIRVVPQYVGPGPEVLLLSSPELSRDQYVVWDSLLAILGLKHGCWDSELQGSVFPESSTALSWLGKHQLVLIPQPPATSSLPDLVRRVLERHVAAAGGAGLAESTSAVIGHVSAADLEKQKVDLSSVPNETQEIPIKVGAGGGCCACFGPESPEAAAAEAAQKVKVKKEEEEPLYKHVVAPYLRLGQPVVTLKIFKSPLPAYFRVRAIPNTPFAIPSGLLPPSKSSIAGPNGEVWSYVNLHGSGNISGSATPPFATPGTATPPLPSTSAAAPPANPGHSSAPPPP